MPTVNYWSNVQVAVQSALAAADTITAITKADPGVVTSTAHGISDGAYVLLDVEGMHQLDGRVIRVANGTANDFELEGIDTTSFSTFSSGTAEDITFGTTITTFTDVTATGGDPEFADITTIHDNVRKQAPTITAPFQLAFESLWDPADAGMIALKAASDAIATRAIKLSFASGSILVFNGYVSAPGVPNGAAQEKVVTPVTITSTGTATVYAS